MPPNNVVNILWKRYVYNITDTKLHSQNTLTKSTTITLARIITSLKFSCQYLYQSSPKILCVALIIYSKPFLLFIIITIAASTISTVYYYSHQYHRLKLYNIKSESIAYLYLLHDIIYQSIFFFLDDQFLKGWLVIKIIFLINNAKEFKIQQFLLLCFT